MKVKSIIIHSIAALSIVLLANGCLTSFDCIEGRGPIVKQERNLSEINKIVIAGSADIFLTQGNTQSVIVETNENIINHVETNVVNGTVTIGSKRSICPDRMNVYITAKSLNGINIKGSGDIKTINKFVTDNIFIAIDGSGDVAMDIDSKYTKLMINGSGDVKLSGTSEKFDIEVDGSGDIEASHLIVANANVGIYGSGDCRLYVTDILNARIYGSGNIFYWGNPKNVNTDIQGSGDIIRR